MDTLPEEIVIETAYVMWGGGVWKLKQMTRGKDNWGSFEAHHQSLASGLLRVGKIGYRILCTCTPQ